MGFNLNEGYYQKHVKQKGYKITDEQEKFNSVDINDIRSGIGIAERQYAKDKNMEIPPDLKRKESIEYVVEEPKQGEEMEL